MLLEKEKSLQCPQIPCGLTVIFLSINTKVIDNMQQISCEISYVCF